MAARWGQVRSQLMPQIRASHAFHIPSPRTCSRPAGKALTFWRPTVVLLMEWSLFEQLMGTEEGKGIYRLTQLHQVSIYLYCTWANGVTITRCQDSIRGYHMMFPGLITGFIKIVGGIMPLTELSKEMQFRREKIDLKNLVAYSRSQNQIQCQKTNGEMSEFKSSLHTTTPSIGPRESTGLWVYLTARCFPSPTKSASSMWDELDRFRREALYKFTLNPYER